MKKLFIIIALIFFVSGNIFAISVDKMKELIVINNSGSADIDAELTISKLSDTVFYFPVRFSNPTDFEVEPKEKFDFSVVSESGMTMLRIKYKGDLNDSTFVMISFYVSHLFRVYEHPIIDFASKQFVNKFQNLTFDLVSNFSSSVVLPEGYVISKINSFSPDGKNGFYNVSNNGIRESIDMKSSSIEKGGGPSVDFTFRAANKTKITIAIIILSLIVFTWLIKLRRRMKGRR